VLLIVRGILTALGSHTAAVDTALQLTTALVLIRPDPRRKRAATTPKMKPPTWAKHGTVSPKCAPN